VPRVCKKSLPKEARKKRAFLRRWIGDVQCYNVGAELRRTIFLGTSP
jgi:hypothetical protein